MNRKHTFEIEKKVTPNSNLVYLKGELDLSKAAEFRAAADSFVADTDRLMVLNLKHLGYIDSTGIGVILSLLKARHVLKAPIIVEDIPPKIKRLFDMTGLTPFIQETKNNAI
ncbi:anti-sigma F factor antagonist [Paenibacillus vulneris]|uniref:Anti-sigma factor antagonist n=1 Tax=Paenibacillus vulneris TaxID=1133364 RepID=A0ABW3UV28_9BACL|nr:STAS domain-containing protein [Paenibacillus sp. OAS669]MBE1446211.1 anti-sigma B factor antagonist [Paenibacillus sp. OAS669]